MQKIIPHLWFDNGAEEAVNFYTSVFKNSRIINVAHYGKAGSEISGMVEGSVMTVEFELGDQKFMALNGGPVFKFTPAISFFVNCDTQEEVDKYWDQLSEGGEESQCGWLKDKYGVSWQIVPTALGEMLSDPSRSGRVMEELLKMKKIDIQRLKEAYEKQ